MNFRKLACDALPAVILTAGLCGCLPSGSNPLEEQKEPHFLAGKARAQRLDFQAAAESFTKALEVNPRSSSAHFELGLLYEEKLPDPAAAIYHYEKYVRLRPHAENAEWVRQRINACKQDLAKTVLPLPITQSLQREFEQLAEENRRLKDEVARWQAYASALARAPTNASTPVLIMQRPDAAGPPSAAPSAAPNPPLSVTPAPVAVAPAPAVAPRSHAVRSGDTLYSIARQYRVKLDALMAANPGINPRRLAVDQKLNLPPP